MPAAMLTPTIVLVLAMVVSVLLAARRRRFHIGRVPLEAVAVTRQRVALLPRHSRLLLRQMHRLRRRDLTVRTLWHGRDGLEGTLLAERLED